MCLTVTCMCLLPAYGWPCAGPDHGQDIEDRIAAAIASVQEEAEETQNDLMVCIGEEQEKVER